MSGLTPYFQKAIELPEVPCDCMASNMCMRSIAGVVVYLERASMHLLLCFFCDICAPSLREYLLKQYPYPHSPYKQLMLEEYQILLAEQALGRKFCGYEALRDLYDKI